MVYTFVDSKTKASVISNDILANELHAFFYKQREAEIGKNLSKS